MIKNNVNHDQAGRGLFKPFAAATLTGGAIVAIGLFR
jgi:hypothetical protein